MPPRAKGKKNASNAGLLSSRLRERTFTKYDEEVADEEDGEDQLFEQPSSDESSVAGSEALAAPLAAAGRGRGRGRGHGKAGALAAAPPSGRGGRGLRPAPSRWRLRAAFGSMLWSAAEGEP